MAVPGLAAVFGQGAGKLLEEGIEEIRKLRQSVDDLRTEWGTRKHYPASLVAWDRIELVTVAADDDQILDLVEKFGAPATGVTVLSAAASPNAPEVSVNGSETFEVVTGDDFDHGRIYQVRVKNPSGGSDAELALFLAAVKAGGRGPWA